MALATFEAQINDLVGTFEDQNAMDTFLTDGVKQVMSILPPEKLAECSTTTTLNNSPSTLDLDTATIGPVLNVVRKDANGYNQACRLIPSMLSSRVTDPNDLMHATASDPVYFINNAVLNVYPDPTASQTADVADCLTLTQGTAADFSIAIPRGVMTSCAYNEGDIMMLDVELKAAVNGTDNLLTVDVA